MGLDVGGSGGRCLLVNVESGQVVTALRGWEHRVVPGTAGLGFDLDLESLWARLGEASREALERAGARPEQVLGMAVTSMRFALVVVDRAGRAVFGAPNRDGRAGLQALELARDHGEEIHRRSGHWPSAVFALARLRWLATNAETWKRADKALALSDWVTYRLCGELASEPSQAGHSALLDLDADDWAWDLIERLELPRKLFPPMHPCGHPLGTLREEAASALGLRTGTPVALGGGDTQCALLGAGAVEAGEFTAVAGTTAPVQLVLDTPLRDAEARLWAARHVVPERWVLESNAGPLGEVLDRFARVLYPDAPHAIARLAAEAQSSPIGAGGILSNLGVALMNGREMSVPIGSITLSHMTLPSEDPAARGQVGRAILEGMAYGLRANVEQLRAASGRELSALRLTGGMSRSAAWSQLLSDVMHVPIVVPATVEASALGAAICAGAGAGVFKDLLEGSAALVRSGREYTPEPDHAERYEACYQDWREFQQAREPADKLAAQIALRAILSTPGPLQAERGPRFRPRILVTADLDSAGLAALRSLGEVEYASYREAMRLLTGPDLARALAGYDVFVTEIDVVDVAALRELPELRVIVVCRGDAVNTDLAACSALGIPVLNTPGRNADAVADLTVGFALMLARKLPEASAFLREPGGEAGDMARMGQAFQRLRGRELWRKTIGLIGLGAVGRGVARRLRAFGARILVYDPYLPEESARMADAEPVSLEVLLAESDFVSLHAAVTDDSRGLIGAAELARMKPGAYLINTARSALIDEEALIEALRSGHLGGAALDVFAVEPPGPDHPLLALPNVIATPHVGGNTVEVSAHQGLIVAEELERLLDGERPQHLLNPEALQDFSWQSPRKPQDPELLERLASGPGPAVTDLQQKKTSAPPQAAKKERSKAAMPTPASKTTDTGAIRSQMERILRDFVGRVQQDEKLQAFAGGKDVMLQFSLTDLDLEFYIGFQGDAVHSNLGAAPESAGVQLKMGADVLDGMMTGRVNAMQSAMSGKLSFSGDTAKAMTLQHIQRDLSRLYSEAREEIGDPGDLSALAQEGAAAATPVGQDDPRQQLVNIVNELYSTQLITATGGNVSVRIPGTDELWITPSQLFKGDLSPEILVRINLDGESLDKGARSPSSELLMHCAVYKARSDVQCVVHAHAPHATILANAELPFLPISTEAAFFADLPRIPFVMPGTQALGDAIVEAMGKGWAVLMQNHGLLVAGRSLRRAADMCEIIDRSSEVILGCYAVGKEPPTLPKDTVDMLRKMGDLIA